MSINDRIKAAYWKIEDDGYVILHHRSEKPFENEPTEFEDSRLNKAIKYHNEKWFHNELVVRATNATIEPQYAYAIDGLRTIIGASIRTRENLPSPIPTLKAILSGDREKLSKAILFDGSMGINYFHFLSDVLHKIHLLERFTELDCPLLVGKAVWSKPFFQFFINETELSKLDWRTMEKPVFVKELFIARPMPYGKDYWLRTKKLFIKKDNVLNGNKSIFVNRAGTRHITNFDVIKPIFENHGVSIVDPGSMSVSEQAALFNSPTHIVGIHGAGLTNVVFSDHHRTKVLELCSNNRIGTQYYWLCTALGMEWDMMLGSEANADQSFELDPEAFEKRLIEFLAS